MSDEDEGQHRHKRSTPPSVQGDEDLDSPTSDDDVDEMVEEVIGREPKQGETFNDMINGTKPEEAPKEEDEDLPNKPPVEREK